MDRNRAVTLRRSAKMTQEEFAEHCNVSRATISRFERGEEISMDIAKKIAVACKVSIDYLLGADYPESDTALYENPSMTILDDVEMDLISDFRNLSDPAQKRLLQTLNDLRKLYPRERASHK